jgi:hypothetical protein
VASSYECGNDPSGPIKYGGFRDNAEDFSFSGRTTDKLYESVVLPTECCVGMTFR